MINSIKFDKIDNEYLIKGARVFENGPCDFLISIPKPKNKYCHNVTNIYLFG